jgi:dihydrolipoamide dehydrogenase
VVTVGGERLVARRAVMLAPGTTALLPPIPGLREARPWTNREATTAHGVPERLVVLGGGPVGCELAQAYRSFGAEVTMVEAAERVLAREEPLAGTLVAKAMAGAGIDVRTGVKAIAVHREGGAGALALELDDGSRVEADELLCAVGRRPHTEDLGLETIGLEGGGTIDVNDDLRVPGHDWLYVLGDANGRVLLTHMGKYQARVAAEHVLGRAVPLRSDGAQSPRVTFTEPNVAAVGHTLDSARESGLDALCVEAGPSENAGGSFFGRGADGTMRLVIDRATDRIVGATIVGAEIAEFLHAATLAVVGELTMHQAWHAVPAFPTRSEVWLRLVEAWERERDPGAAARA